MCIAAVVGLAGAVFSTAAQMQQASTAEAIAERNAKQEQLRGEYEARQIEHKLRYVQGQATVNAAANGVDATGSYLDIIADNEVQGEIDAENARRFASNRADTMRLEGKATASRLRYGAVGSLIGATGTFLKSVA